MLYPREVLKGPYPLLVDKWQNASVLWDAARRLIDFGDGPGMFIFTGSVSPPDGAAVVPVDCLGP
jgi:hypothetical protein